MTVLVTALVPKARDSGRGNDTRGCQTRKHSAAILRLRLLQHFKVCAILRQGSLLSLALAIAPTTIPLSLFEALVKLAHKLLVLTVKQILLIALDCALVLLVSLHLSQDVLLRAVLLHRVHSCLSPNLIRITIISTTLCLGHLDRSHNHVGSSYLPTSFSLFFFRRVLILLATAMVLF